MIVGQTVLLSSLDEVFDKTEGGRSGTVLVLGDPGMGKSSILERARHDAQRRGWSVVVTAAAEGSSEVAFALAHDLMHDLRATSGRSAADGREAFRQVVEPTRWQVQPVAGALRELLVDAAATAPVLVLIDDLHWADEESLSALALAAARAPGARVAIVATAWPSTGGDPRLIGWTHLRLDPLPVSGAVDVLQTVVSPALDADQAARVARALGCCPLALVECRRLLTPAQIAGTEPLPEPVPVGERLRHEWGLVVARLPMDTQRALLAVSVLDTSYPALMAEALAAVECCQDDLGPALRQGLLVPGPRGVPVTAGALVRAAVLDAHSPHDVRAMHRRMADVAARVGSPPAVVISHLCRGAQRGDRVAVNALEQQAQRAHERAQAEVEARAWQAAAELSDVPTERATRAVRAARVWLRESASATGAGSLLALLNETPLGPDDTVWREWTRAEVLAESDLAESAAAALLAARHAETTQPALVPWLLWDAAATAWMADDADLALVAATRLMDWTSTAAMVDAAHVPSWLAAAVLGTAYLHAGRTSEGVELVQSARTASHSWRAEPSTPLSQLVNAVALDELMLADGMEQRARVHDLASRLADDGASTKSSVLTIQGWQAYRRGDWAVARRHAGEAVDLARAVRAATQERSALMLLVRLLHAVEDDAPNASATADDVLTRLRYQASRVGDRRALAAADRAAGLRCLATGQVGDAVAALGRARDTRCRGRGTADARLPATVDLVEALLRVGDPAAARALAHQVVAELAAVSPIDPDASALASRARALTAEDGEADAHFALALTAHRCGRDEFESARTRMLLGDHLRRTRRASQGRQELLTAAMQMDILGAEAWARRARDQAALGRREHHGDEATWQSRLTTQERRVAREVGRGATNAEVAAALSLSPRTVEWHLASAYRKLGVRNRVELADLIRD